MNKTGVVIITGAENVVAGIAGEDSHSLRMKGVIIGEDGKLKRPFSQEQFDVDQQKKILDTLYEKIKVDKTANALLLSKTLFQKKENRKYMSEIKKKERNNLFNILLK